MRRHRRATGPSATASATTASVVSSQRRDRAAHVAGTSPAPPRRHRQPVDAEQRAELRPGDLRSPGTQRRTGSRRRRPGRPSSSRPAAARPRAPRPLRRASRTGPCRVTSWAEPELHGGRDRPSRRRRSRRPARPGSRASTASRAAGPGRYLASRRRVDPGLARRARHVPPQVAAARRPAAASRRGGAASAPARVRRQAVLQASATRRRVGAPGVPRQGASHVGDRAERERRQHARRTRVRARQPLAAETDAARPGLRTPPRRSRGQCQPRSDGLRRRRPRDRAPGRASR